MSWEERAGSVTAAAEPDRVMAGTQGTVPEPMPSGAVRPRGRRSSVTRTRNLRGLMGLRNRKAFRTAERWNIEPEGTDCTIKSELLSSKARGQLDALKLEISPETHVKA